MSDDPAEPDDVEGDEVEDDGEADEADEAEGDVEDEPHRDRPPTPRRWRARVPQGSQLVVTVVALAVAIVAVVLLVGPTIWEKVKPDDIDAAPAFVDYCREVKTQQAALSQIDDSSPSGLLAALPSLEALQAKAPADIADDWDTVVARTRALVDALDAAGVDPSDYDDYAQVRRDLDPDDRRAVAAAVKRLVEPDTIDAFEAVQQQARDVCKTPLTTS